VPGPGASFYHNEAARKVVYAQTRFALRVIILRNGRGSGPTAVRTAKREGPSQRGHRAMIIMEYDRFAAGG
jgi:hypothetical protein